MLATFQLLLQGFMLLGIGLLHWLMPGLTRRDLLFGVTVPANARQTPAGQRIIRRFRLGVVVVVALDAAGLVAQALLATDHWWASAWPSLTTILLLLLLAVPYLLAHRASRALALEGAAERPLPPAAPAAELRPRRYSDALSWAWETLPLAIIVVTASYLAATYATAPAIIPTHFNAAGVPNAYRPKTIGSYFPLIWIQITMEVLLTAVALLVARAKAQPGRANERFRVIILRGLFGLKTLLLLFLGGLAVLIARAEASVAFPGGAVLALALGFVAALLLGVIALALSLGQGGARRGSPAETATDRMDDRYWKLGIIYINAQDPSLLVERRFGIGWTFNFGNPKSVVFLMGLVVLAFVPLVIRLATR